MSTTGKIFDRVIKKVNGDPPAAKVLLVGSIEKLTYRRDKTKASTSIL